MHRELHDAWSPLLHACCVVVRGATRALIYDLQRQRALSLPASVHDLLGVLTTRRGATLATLKGELPAHDHARLDALLRFLIERDLAFFTPHPERFPLLDLRPSGAAVLESALLDVDDRSDHDMSALLAQLMELGCARLAVRARLSNPLPWIETLLQGMETGGTGMTLDLQVEAHPQLTAVALRTLCQRHARIGGIEVLAADRDETIQVTPSGFGRIILRRAPLDFQRAEAPGRFGMRIGMELFCESQQHNTFTNRRVCISARGAIGNSVGDVPRFGLLSQVQLAEVVKLSAFQAAWSVHKGLIVGCRDCEFRHACVDPRLPTARGDGTYEHRSACHYDPQHGQWRPTSCQR